MYHFLSLWDDLNPRLPDHWRTLYFFEQWLGPIIMIIIIIDLTREQKETIEQEGDGNTNCNWRTRKAC